MRIAAIESIIQLASLCWNFVFALMDLGPNNTKPRCESEEQPVYSIHLIPMVHWRVDKSTDEENNRYYLLG